MTATPATLIRDLSERLGQGADLAQSFRNYHVHGVDYVCLHRDANLTVKLYRIDPTAVLNADGHLVIPHDHAYIFDTYVLAGQVANVLFTEAAGDDWVAHTYTRQPGGGGRLTPCRRCALVPDTLWYQQGGMYHLGLGEIHTLVPDLSSPVLLALYEQRTFLDSTTSYLRAEAAALGDEPGLYQPMDTGTANNIVFDAINALEALAA